MPAPRQRPHCPACHLQGWKVGRHLGRHALQLVKLNECFTAVVDTVRCGSQVAFPVTHDLRRETGLRWPGVRVTFFFPLVLLCINEVEGRKGKGDHVKGSLWAALSGAGAATSPMIPQHNDSPEGGAHASEQRASKRGECMWVRNRCSMQSVPKIARGEEH